MSETLGSLLHNACLRYGDRVALVGRDGNRTYRQLLERGSRLANGLAGLGLKPGDHVAALLEDTVTAFEVYFGCALGGFPLVHVNDRLVSREIDFILEDSESTVLIHTDGRTPVIDELASLSSMKTVITIGDNLSKGSLNYEKLLEKSSSITPPDTRKPEDLAILGYTSGTTGFPKGSMSSHRAVVGCIKLIPFAYRLPMYGRCAFTGTLSFVSGIWGVILPHLYTGGTVSFLAPYTVETWVDHMINNKSTFTYAPSPLVPGFIEEVGRRRDALTHLETVLHSASPLPPAHAQALVELIGERYVEVWGMTETVAPLTVTAREDWRGVTRADDIFSSVGRPLMTASIRVVDSQRQPVAPGETGELVVSADTMFSGYYNRPDKTSEVLVNGEYFTGDIGRIDAAGYIYVTDRATDMIITGGMNVYPAEVEAYLAQLTQIAEVAVVGTPDAKWGETVTAVVVLKNGQTISQEDILRHVKTGLASYKKPTQIVFAESLPRNAGMKVQKHILKASLKEGKL